MSKKTLGIILLLAGLALAIFGYMQFQDSGTNIGIGDLDINIKDEKSQTGSYIMMGGGVLAFVFGALMVLRSKG